MFFVKCIIFKGDSTCSKDDIFVENTKKHVNSNKANKKFQNELLCFMGFLYIPPEHVLFKIIQVFLNLLVARHWL
jgi:hypothetical protein